MVSCEKFGFLFDGQILDAIGITQEVIHTIKQKNKKALLFKMDLEKALEKVDWDYLRLIRIQIGLPLSIVKCIMACVSSAQFAVLVNGDP